MATKVRASVFTICALFLGTATVSAQISAEASNPPNSEIDGKKGTISDLTQYLDRTGEPVLFGEGFSPEFITVKGDFIGPIELSVHNGVNAVLQDEIHRGMNEFAAKAAVGFLLKLNNGEIIGLASDAVGQFVGGPSVNRVTQAIYEISSVGRMMTLGLALDSGSISLKSKMDARKPINFQRAIIRDFHAQNRELTVPEVFYYSSNIGMSRISETFSPEKHRSFFEKFGQLQPIDSPILSSTDPLYPRSWERLNTYAISFGHGIAVSPLHAGMAISTLLNGGYLVKPTLIKQSESELKPTSPRLISAETSENLRYLFRRNAEVGAAKIVDISGFYVGGIPSTVNKVVNGRYTDKKVITTFISAFPMDKPEYLLLVVLDEPNASESSNGFKTAAWNAGAVSAKIINRVAPLIGVEKRRLPTSDPFPKSSKASGVQASFSADAPPIN